MILDARYARVLAAIRRHGPLSRSQLSERLGLRPNSTGDLVTAMVGEGLLREGDAGTVSRGRPRTPLEIDPAGRHVLGVAIQPDGVSACRVNLLGQRVGPLLEQSIGPGRRTETVAARLLKRLNGNGTLAIGVSAAGFVDPEAQAIFFSRTAALTQPIDLASLHKTVGGRPIVLDNDMHALAAKWLLGHAGSVNEDVLMVGLRDGSLGASLLVEGKPNRGCVVAGNELGHTRFFIDTEPCYCGQTGCLERICSSDFLRRQGGRLTLDKACATWDGRSAPLGVLLKHVGAGIANAVNLLRPHRLVIVSPLNRHAAFMNQLQRQIVQMTLQPIANRLRIDRWSADHESAAEAAGWLALSRIYLQGLTPARP